MRFNLIFFLIILTSLFSCNKKKASNDPLDAIIKQEFAQNDFKIFRNILERGHPALTQYMTAREKDRCLDSLYETISKEITLREFYKKISFFIDKIGCSHTVSFFPAETMDSLYNRKLFFPFTTILLGDGLFVNGDDDLPHGTQLLSVNHIPANEIIDSLLRYNPIEGYVRKTKKYVAARDFAIDYYTHFGAASSFNVLVKDTSGKIKTLFFEPVTLDELLRRKSNSYFFDATDVPYSFSVYDGYAELRLATFEFDTHNQQRAFERFLANSFELLSLKKNIKSLVIDLRENTGGDLYNCFLLHSYLAKNKFREYRRVFSLVKKVPLKEYLSGATSEDDIEDIEDRLKEEFIGRSKRGYFIPDSLIDEWNPDPKRFTGNTYIITNQEVVSAASYFALLTRNNGNAKIVGTETSGGSYSGNGFKTMEYTLPATQIRFEFPYAKLYYSFHGENNGSGLIPDYVIEDSYKSFDMNEDNQWIYIKDSLLIKNR